MHMTRDKQINDWVVKNEQNFAMMILYIFNITLFDVLTTKSSFYH